MSSRMYMNVSHESQKRFARLYTSDRNCLPARSDRDWALPGLWFQSGVMVWRWPAWSLKSQRGPGRLIASPVALSVPTSCDASCSLPALLLNCGFYSLRSAAVRVLKATAVEAVGRIVGVSDGIVVAEHFVVQGGVGLAGALVHDSMVLPIGAAVHILQLLLIAAGGWW